MNHCRSRSCGRYICARVSALKRNGTTSVSSTMRFMRPGQFLRAHAIRAPRPENRQRTLPPGRSAPHLQDADHRPARTRNPGDISGQAGAFQGLPGSSTGARVCSGHCGRHNRSSDRCRMTRIVLDQGLPATQTRLLVDVGQPIQVADPLSSGSCRLKAGCGQEWPPHKFTVNSWLGQHPNSFAARCPSLRRGPSCRSR